MAVLGAFPPGIGCRPFDERDWGGVADCLHRGFPERSRSYWIEALTRLAQRPAVVDFPRYGFVLEKSGRIVGAVLTLYAKHRSLEGDEIRCNLSSWSVDAEFRPYASRMIATVTLRKDVVYTNISPSPGTVRLNKAFGFRLFSGGQIAFLPILNGMPRPDRVLEAHADLAEMAELTDNERYILLEHAALGCLSLICVCDGLALPLVLKPRRILHGLVSCCQVVYCRSHADLVRCAGVVGRFLLRRGQLLCLVDAMGPVPGLSGRYFPNKGIKYFKGPKSPSPGDLTFTEMVLFGS
ncbi:MULTISPECIES: hypothetical protein [unclassified Mesorhizobium]|uniref:hypothetical protein n=1 Tax=unclassified Mesorhizobium TaxID=325217 RepID=UPI0024172ACC|nr:MULTISPECIES: hypothetical protein [unclassified Mesorhizobium]MDG4887140.1 hypothetical protein [Mesorhizobium sp. WSM4887]